MSDGNDDGVRVPAPIHQWIPQPLSAEVAAALERIGRSDDVRHVAVMPDVHLAADVCIGTVVATERLIYPNAVGSDIGCGVAALAFDRRADALRREAVAARVLSGFYRAVPTVRHHRPPRPDELAGSPFSDEKLNRLLARDGAVQFATLGRGNHFLELQADEEGGLWLMVHSGSRAVGQAVRDLHLARAMRGATGLGYLDADTDAGRAYLADADVARRYARENRRAMAVAAAAVVADVLGAQADAASYFDCDHNHVEREAHLGQEWWVHRKGAIRAGPDKPGIIPGSMGTESFHVTGRGLAESLCSSSHGAGRAMSREHARRRISTKDLEREMRGVWFDRRMSSDLRDEAPSAYKDVRDVFRAQHDLTRVVRRLKPVLCFKGT